MTILSVIIISYNTRELTVRCLKSIIKQYQEQLQSGDFEIIVVDNNSTDDTVIKILNLKSKILNLKIIENKKNYGFSKANNIGARSTSSRYLFFLNSDTEVKDKGLLSMVDFINKNQQVGILGARLVNNDGSVQPSTGPFYTLANATAMLFGGEKLGLVRKSPKEISQVDWVSGGAMMVGTGLFNKLGGFDEKLFMYIEDMEFCWRAKKNKTKTYFYPNISIVHKQLGSSNRTFAILNIYQGLLYFYKKHMNYLEYLLVKLMLKTKASLAVVIGIMVNNAYLKETYRKALAL